MMDIYKILGLEHILPAHKVNHPFKTFANKSEMNKYLREIGIISNEEYISRENHEI